MQAYFNRDLISGIIVSRREVWTSKCDDLSTLKDEFGITNDGFIFKRAVVDIFYAGSGMIRVYFNADEDAEFFANYILKDSRVLAAIPDRNSHFQDNFLSVTKKNTKP